MRACLLILAFLAGCGDAAVVQDIADAGTTVVDAGTTSTATTTTTEPTTDAGEPPLVDGPKLAWWTQATTPGGSVYIRTTAPIAGLELRIDGTPLPTPPLVLGRLQDETHGALFAVPEDTATGVATLTLRPAGGDADSDRRKLAIAPPLFVDVAAEVGLANLHDVTGHPDNCAWSQSGLAFADVDNDGDSDAYVGNVGSPGRLLANDGAQPSGLPIFKDLTQGLGLGVDNVSAASFVDYDNDGDRDLFVGRRGANVLLRNRLVETGTLGFADVTAEAGLGGGEQRTMGASWGDYDGDGDLDLYVVNHAWCFPNQGSPLNAQDHLYRNDGATFTEVTDLLGTDPASPVHALGFSAVWVDSERDGDLDLVVVNDHIGGLSGPNAMWRNDGPDEQGLWRFTDTSASSGVAILPNPNGEGANGMGLAIGDVDFDGFVDLAFTNIGPNYLLLNRGDGTFDNVSEARGVRRGQLPWKAPSITWAVHLLDYDNDADLDLYYAGGDIHANAQIPDALLRNDGAEFHEVTWAAGLTAFGHAKGSALVDLDRDGRLEFATAHWARPLRVFHNRTGEPGHWLVVDLVGTSSNRDALGSIVAVEAAGLPTQTCFRSGNPSLGAGGELACHFGLAAATTIDRVTITWPDGQVATPPPPAVDTRVTYTQ